MSKGSLALNEYFLSLPSHFQSESRCFVTVREHLGWGLCEKRLERGMVVAVMSGCEIAE